MTKIHKTAIVDPSAEIGSDVEIGAYTVIGAHTTIGDGSCIKSHVVIDDHTSLGRNNQVFQFSSIGAAPQDQKYQGQEANLIIGDNNIIREFSTINSGSTPATTIGNHNWIMAYVHIAHDCQIGDHVTFVNGATLAGHVEVNDHVIVGAFTKVHQFCRLGAYSLSRHATLTQDLMPYVIAVGEPVKLYGLNKIGLQRHQFNQELISVLSKVYRKLTTVAITEEDMTIIEDYAQQYPEVRMWLDFIEKSKKNRGYIR